MTRADIMRRIYELDDEGFTIHAALLYRRDKDFCFEACAQFGSVQKAVEAAGLKYPEVDEVKLKFTMEEMDRRVLAGR